MGQIDQRLHHPLVGGSFYLVQKQIQDDGNREIENQIIKRQHDRIGKQKSKTVHGASVKHPLEIIEAHPGTACHSQRRKIILEDDNQVTGGIQLEYNINCLLYTSRDCRPWWIDQALIAPTCLD